MLYIALFVCNASGLRLNGAGYVHSCRRVSALFTSTFALARMNRCFENDVCSSVRLLRYVHCAKTMQDRPMVCIKVEWERVVGHDCVFGASFDPSLILLVPIGVELGRQ